MANNIHTGIFRHPTPGGGALLRGGALGEGDPVHGRNHQIQLFKPRLRHIQGTGLVHDVCLAPLDDHHPQKLPGHRLAEIFKVPVMGGSRHGGTVLRGGQKAVSCRRRGLDILQQGAVGVLAKEGMGVGISRNLHSCDDLSYAISSKAFLCLPPARTARYFPMERI